MTTAVQDEAELANRATTTPNLGNNSEIDPAILRALPVAGTKLISTYNYSMSRWGKTVKLICRLPGDERINYFLKVTPPGDVGRHMAEGEYHALKEMHDTSPVFCPEPYTWGCYDKQEPETYFLLVEFRNVGEQPPEPIRFTARLAEMHRNSVSPTWKFGFHATTCHATLSQTTNTWEEWWWKLYQKQYARTVQLDLDRNDPSPEFKLLADLTLQKVIRRLLEPLQTGGRSIEPCLVHGDVWDENAATDMNTGEPFVYDAASFYGHNEYDIGNWRTSRHRMSNQTYIRAYKRNFPVSEPEEEWDHRNLLYFLSYELHAAMLFPGSRLRKNVYDGMMELCHTYCPKELKAAQEALKRRGTQTSNTKGADGVQLDGTKDDSSVSSEPEPEDDQEEMG